MLRKKRAIQKPVRPKISLPLENPEFVDEKQQLGTLGEEMSTSLWKPVEYMPTRPKPSVSLSPSSHKSFMSSPGSSRASSSSRTSYNSVDEYFSTAEKKVSFSRNATIIPRSRESSGSTASSIYGAEGVLPPPIEDDGRTTLRIGRSRFAAAEYIREIEGTPMILVDGKLYL
jgi:hypothetical protein